jgi:hypothetical protein
MYREESVGVMKGLVEFQVFEIPTLVLDPMVAVAKLPIALAGAAAAVPASRTANAVANIARRNFITPP